jgi:nitroreductase
MPRQDVELFEAIYQRQSIGKVKADPVPRELIEQLLSAAVQAPNHHKVRPWRFVVLQGAAVGVDKPTFSKVSDIENVAATSAAIENLLLAAHALGLGAMWRTGPAATAPSVKAFLGFEPDQHMIGLVYVGYPEIQPASPERPTFEDRVVWLD